MEHEEIEDGEIVDDTDHYTPLERPANYSQLQQPLTRFPVILPDSDSEELQSSDSDSDSDAQQKKCKKPKIKLKPKQQHPTKKKYDIWSTRVQEDVLAETLNSCDVTKKDRSRDVETYDYNLAREYYKELDQRTNNKRTRDDRKNTKFRPRKRSKSRDKPVKSTPRVISDLVVSNSNTQEEIARDISNKLFEEKEDLIFKVITAMGKDRAIEFFNETKQIEADGGMLIMNQTRRRTPGGVYLYLVRQDYHITPEQKNIIFGEEKQLNKERLKRKQRLKNNKIKMEIAASKTKLLPDLLNRAEILASQNNRTRKETNETEDVINPPPTPETDCHENSGDGMENVPNNVENSHQKLTTYDDDFLDIHSNQMDLF